MLMRMKVLENLALDYWRSVDAFGVFVCFLASQSTIYSTSRPASGLHRERLDKVELERGVVQLALWFLGGFLLGSYWVSIGFL